MRRALLLVLLAACGGGDDDGDDGVTYEYLPCDADEHVGTFFVTTLGVQGRVEDAVAPLAIPDEIAGAGECRVLRSPALFCDPACEVGSTCSQEGTCVPLPVRLSAGEVAISGLSAAVTMAARAPDYSYTNPEPLPDPAFAPGADIQLHAQGDDVAAFDLAGVGVAPIAGAPAELAVAEGEPLEVTWDLDGVGARMRVLLDFAQHGGPHIFIDCDFADTEGVATVPAELLQELLDSEVSGFPGAILTRHTVMSADLEPGCVDLEIATTASIPVEVPGVISCTDDEPCPDLQTCQPNLTCG
ncbi:MAG TPA: hypothetical protein VMZ28_11700 [Kofleriaceae bacterium]|nr:hypothetical protein [Kofleriaceae bacterium]